jgi:hypothetical protein
MTAQQIVESITAVYGDDQAAFQAALTSQKKIADRRQLEFERDKLQAQTEQQLAQREALIASKNDQISALRDSIVDGISV